MINLNAEFRHRMPEHLHARVKKIAEEKGVSVTGLINMVMSEHVEGDRIQDLEKRVSELEKEVFKK